MLNILIAVQIFSALAMVTLILLQHGKGADMGAAFGSGASGSLFGASGGANFLSHATATLATVFFVSTLGQAWLMNSGSDSSVESQVLEQAFSQQTVPDQDSPDTTNAVKNNSSDDPVPESTLPSGK